MSGPLWTSADAARATGGETQSNWRASGVSIDTRSLQPGDLFIALPGETHDGHGFVGAAFAKGAAAAIVMTPPDNIDGPLLRVADSYQALDGLARYSRQRLNGHVTAVTGSVGKTGVKDALHHAFSQAHAAYATQGNFNNQIGLPLTLARAPAETERTVLELGTGGPGEIAPLAKLARPHTAIIVSVEQAHAEHFAGLADIALEKAAIFTGMTGGTAILPRDNPLFALLRETALDHGADRILSFGAHPEAQARLSSCRIDKNGTQIEADIEGVGLNYRLPILGRHWAVNSLAVLAAVGAAGNNLEKAAASLAGFSVRSGRGDCQSVSLNGGGFTLIDESYNASPSSMRAAISVLGHVHPGPSGRRIAALGDMLELGPSASRHHAALADCLIRAGVDLVFAAGSHMRALHAELPPSLRGAYAETADRLAPEVAAAIHAGDVVTVKGSHGSHMSLVADALRAKGQRGDAAQPQQH